MRYTLREGFWGFGDNALMIVMVLIDLKAFH